MAAALRCADVRHVACAVAFLLHRSQEEEAAVASPACPCIRVGAVAYPCLLS